MLLEFNLLIYITIHPSLSNNSFISLFDSLYSFLISKSNRMGKGSFIYVFILKLFWLKDLQEYYLHKLNLNLSAFVINLKLKIKDM